MLFLHLKHFPVQAEVAQALAQKVVHMDQARISIVSLIVTQTRSLESSFSMFYLLRSKGECYEKSKCIYRPPYGLDRPRHRGAGAVCAGDVPVGADEVDQLPADDRHVRHGSDDEAVGLRDRVPAAARRDHRVCRAVYRDASAGFCPGAAVWPERRAAGRRRSRGNVPGRDREQRHDVSGEGRHGALRGNDQHQHAAGARAHAASDVPVSQDVRQRGRAVDVHFDHSGGDRADRAGTSDQPAVRQIYAEAERRAADGVRDGDLSHRRVRRVTQQRKDLIHGHRDFRCRDSSQPARVPVRLSGGGRFQDGSAEEKGCGNRDRYAEFGACDVAGRDGLPESRDGDGAGRGLLRVAQYLRRDPRGVV